jgi:Uncharacterised nucleotidyltransferase
VLSVCNPARIRSTHGHWVAAVLAGAWRHTPSAVDLSPAALTEIAPILLGTGAAGLGWWRVRGSDLEACPAARQLRQGYRLHTLHAALHKRELATALTLLRSAGVEPLLGKGWAAAQLYAEPGLRPYGDLDLCVRPEQYAAARGVLMRPAADGCGVDLHRGFAWLDDRCLEELYARSRLIPMGDLQVRVLGPEDHLRLLCLHMLGHGAVRPLWLCDIGAALEVRPADFDWEYCLGGDPRRSHWVVCALGLARRLLKIRLDDTPVAGRGDRLPSWLVPTVLRAWDRSQPVRTSIAYCFHPSRLASIEGAREALAELRRHWPNAIEGTVGVRGPFNNWPRLPFQLGACLVRTVQFLRTRTGEP